MPDPAGRRSPAAAAALIALVAAIGGIAAPATGAAPTFAAVERQVTDAAVSLADGDAEHAMGGYYPGAGAFFSVDMVRGANAVDGRPAERGVQAWASAALKALGTRLDQVPTDEPIGLSARFYDYSGNRWRTLTIVALAANAAVPETFQVTLDGAILAEGRMTPVDAPAPTPTPAPAAIRDTFDDPAATRAAWHVMGGTWSVADGAYRQTMATGLDHATWLIAPVARDVTFSATLRYRAGGTNAGDRGPGLLFGGSSMDHLAGARMVTYTFDGSYLKWGRFDAAGTFLFEGGTTVPNGADGAPHTIAVAVRSTTYDVILDGATLATGVPLDPGAAAGATTSTLASTSASALTHVGLIDSTAQVAYDEVVVTPAGSAS